MNLNLKQKTFSWRSRYAVYDESENEKMLVKGIDLLVSKSFRITDMNGQELIRVKRKTYGATPRYYIIRNGKEIAFVEKDFSMYSHGYDVMGLGWRAEGQLSERKFAVKKGEIEIARISKAENGYKIAFGSDVDEAAALAVILIVNICADSKNYG